MSNLEIIKQLEKVFREVFDNDDIHLSESTNSEDIEAWDSLTHIQLVSEIQKTFGIRINAREMMTWDKVGDMVETIKAKTKE